MCDARVCLLLRLAILRSRRPPLAGNRDVASGGGGRESSAAIFCWSLRCRHRMLPAEAPRRRDDCDSFPASQGGRWLLTRSACDRRAAASFTRSSRMCTRPLELDCATLYDPLLGRPPKGVFVYAYRRPRDMEVSR